MYPQRSPPVIGAALPALRHREGSVGEEAGHRGLGRVRSGGEGGERRKVRD